MSKEFEIVATRDGGRAVLHRESGELMHPLGPHLESQSVYIEPARLKERLAIAELTLFDAGLGAGSNAIAAWRMSEARSAGNKLRIVSFDQTAEAMALAIKTSQPEDFGFDAAGCEAAKDVITHGFHDARNTHWRLLQGSLPETLTHAETLADVVFWDLYSPKANPTMWTVKTFAELKLHCAPRATVHTYGAATSTRVALLLAGFFVGRGPAIGKKAETTIATVDPVDLEVPLDDRWLQRFARSSAALPVDAPTDARAQVIAQVEAAHR